MKLILILIAILLPTIFSNCSNAEFSGLSALGKEHKIQLYSGGVLVKEWTSTGVVKNNQGSDGWYFQDKETKRFVTISGDIVIINTGK